MEFFQKYYFQLYFFSKRTISKILSQNVPTISHVISKTMQLHFIQNELLPKPFLVLIFLVNLYTNTGEFIS